MELVAWVDAIQGASLQIIAQVKYTIQMNPDQHVVTSTM